MGVKYGYIFSRSKEEEKMHRETLLKLQVPEENIYADQASAGGNARPMLLRLERKIRPEDLLYVKSLSWLGNTYDAILSAWRTLTKEQRADIAVLDAPILDTRRGKEFMESFLSDIVSETLFFVAENERAKNRRRQAEGYQAAKARGVRFGRPAAPLPENFLSVVEKWKEGKLTGTLAAKECGMPLSTFRYRAKLLEKGENE